MRPAVPDRAERERLWRRARFAYLIVFLFIVGGIIFSAAAINSLLRQVLR